MALDIQITDQDLPVLSTVAAQALELLRNPNVTNRGIEKLIRQDPSLTERLLRTANSPFYAGRRQSSTISEAILRLGLCQLRNVIIMAATGELFSDQDPVIRGIWEHANATALAAHHLAESLKQAHPEEAYIGGMLQDVGELVIYRQHPQVYGALLEEVKATGRGLDELETERFQFFTHMSVGGLVIRKWKLADGIAEAARFHHTLRREVPSGLQFETQACLTSLADALVCSLGFGYPVQDPAGLPTLACAHHLHLTPPQLETLSRQTLDLLEAQRAMAN